ncbi:polysaccharide export protein [Corynespora cassiicola Philippines]|uniref:Polysaccharide export protein n=1 Tax=Corynespora cassiicola Philippines TaxID=1448308 RepID=A0A2T2NJY5_CORCC|nr:polysaccharide export protein [Corynespora cassiicola Philippines]
MFYVAFVITWDVLCVLRIPSAQRKTTSSFQPPSNERYFIASIHWNNEKILRSHWNKAVVELVKYLGPENTYVAVLESGSWDNSKDALRELDQALGGLNTPRKIVLEDKTHKEEISRLPADDEPGWADTSRGLRELRRIPYLANLRNRVMAEMSGVNDTDNRPFTKVLWLNDVVFNTEDILTLLATNEGSYSAACSLDFSKPPTYYDTFALRDIGGSQPITQTWPYFLSSKSRKALLSNRPVPVQSCWNGVVAMNAEPFLGEKPLKFRGISDSLAQFHLEGSECCLIHVDNPLNQPPGAGAVFVNPNVRVGYNPQAYDVVKVSSKHSWPSFSDRIFGMWGNRWARYSGFLQRNIQHWIVWRRIQQWQSVGPRGPNRWVEQGNICIINEMQVLVENGWKHL